MNDQTTDAPVAPQAPAQEATLSVQDLTTAANIISACVSRGAIKAEEMSAVGEVYNKLTAFLRASAEAKAAAEAAEAAAAAKDDSADDSEDAGESE